MRTKIFIGICITFSLLLIYFLAFPIKGYMKVESIHWTWTINIYEYQKLHKTSKSRKYDSPRAAEREYDSAVRDSLPSDAYKIKAEIRESSRKVSDGENSYHYEYDYYWEFSYYVNCWNYVSEIPSCGNDKNPYEGECDLPMSVENPELGDRRRQVGHNEEYSASGSVDGKVLTYVIPKETWERISVGDEFGYTKFRFGKKIWGIEIAE